MSADTVIQWCDATVNFWWGCTKVSAGCANCYAEKLARAFSGKKNADGSFGPPRATWGPGGLRWVRDKEAGIELVKLELKAKKLGRRLRVFINSMSDTFEDRRDLDGPRAWLFRWAELCEHLDILLLTKRPENVERLVPESWKHNRPSANWPENVWLGFSAEDQAAFDARWPEVENLARRFSIPVVFCSGEPMLGPINAEAALHLGGGEDEPDQRTLDWMIIGGESGRQARPFNVTAARALLRQLQAQEVPVFVKQLGRRPFVTGGRHFGVADVVLKDSHGGDMAEWPEDLRVREVPFIRVP